MANKLRKGKWSLTRIGKRLRHKLEKNGLNNPPKGDDCSLEKKLKRESEEKELTRRASKKGKRLLGQSGINGKKSWRFADK